MPRLLACRLLLAVFVTAGCGVQFQAVAEGEGEGASAPSPGGHGGAPDASGGGSGSLVGGAGGAGATGAGGQGEADGGGGFGGRAAALCDAGAVACLPFDGDTKDASPQANHAVATDVSWVAGKQGQAISLDASSMLILPTHASLGLSAYTMQVWIRPAILPSGTERMALIDASGRWSMWLYPDGLRCRGIAGAAVPVGVWTHVACVHDGSELRAFVDGVQVGAGANAIDPMPPLDDVHLGSDAPAGGDELIGDIDGLVIHAQALSDAEICAAAGKSGC